MRAHKGHEVWSKHNRPILLFILLWIALTTVGLAALFYQLIVIRPAGKEEWDIVLPTAGLLISIAVTVIQFLFSRAIIRSGIIHLFLSEICSIGLAIKHFGLVDMLIGFNPKYAAQYGGWIKSQSSSFTQVFEHNSDKLQMLPPQTVLDVTAFYTYLRTAHDAVHILESWNENTSEPIMRGDVQRALLQLALCFEAGDLAIKELADKHDLVAGQRIIYQQMIAQIRQELNMQGIDVPPERRRVHQEPLPGAGA